MLEELREQANSTVFFDDEEETETPLVSEVQVRRPFLGMTPFQRFLLSLMLLIIVFLVGAFSLLVLGLVQIPV
jgi:hypothetical protein